ncbi:YitT family protein [Agromyces sp. NPDC058484]|uniref:membrane protein YczE n=1 Tax=Agromyces sp. NPDC058484 TaxID=3346524 RepID=UPI003646ADA8
MPRLPADPAPVLVRRFVQLFVGLFLYGIGMALIVRGELGVAPWDVLTQGVAKQTGLGFGLITVITSGVVLLLWIPIRQKPGFGTVMNALLVGPAADVGLWLIPPGLDLWARVILLPAGIVVLAIATGLYIGAHFGPGPRDGLMTGLHRRTGWRIWIVRTGIELVVLAVGWLLGGNVGIGTVAFALLIGPLCGYTIPLFAIKRAERADAAAPPRDARDAVAASASVPPA